MRIGIDAQLLGGCESGVEVCIRNLIRGLALADAENEYVIYTQRGIPPLDVGENSRVTIRHTRWPNRFRPARILWQQAALPHILSRDGIDLLHAPGYVMPRICPCPALVTVYDVIAIKFPELCKRTNALHYGLMLPRTLRRAARILAASERTRDDLVALLDADPERIEVVYPGVDEAFQPVEDPERLAEVRTRLGLPERFILFVGNIEPKKNLPTLIRAFALLKRHRRIPHRLVIAGKKGWKCGDVFRAVRDEGLESEVIFPGYVPLENLPALYSMAELFAFPSLYEGFGLPPLEAMACGTPVVASNAGALPEVLGDAALQVDPLDVDALQKVIHKILTNQFLRRHLSEAGRKRAARFTWAENARKTIAAYERADAPSGEGAVD